MKRPLSPSRRRRGVVSIEVVLNFCTFYTMAGLALRLGFKACALLHHAIATLVGWPIL